MNEEDPRERPPHMPNSNWDIHPGAELQEENSKSSAPARKLQFGHSTGSENYNKESKQGSPPPPKMQVAYSPGGRSNKEESSKSTPPIPAGRT